MPQITPIPGPLSQASSSPSPSQQSARERAIAALQGNTQSTPVSNPNQVSPEELGAIKAPTEEPQEVSGQKSTEEGQPSESQAEATKPETPLSSQYAQLARKEKQLRAQAKATQDKLKAQEAALAAREAAIKAKEAEMQGHYIPKDDIAKDPLKVLQDQGYTADQITQMLLNAPDPAAQQQAQVIDELRAEIKALKDAQESTNKTFQESQTKAYQQAVSQLKAEAKQLVNSDENFEIIKATNSYDDVVELITKTFEKENVLLSVEEAAQAVEEYLAEEAMKVARLKKIQSKLQPVETKKPAPTEGQSADSQQQGQKRPTLTNANGAPRQLTSRERAILAFKGELK